MSIPLAIATLVVCWWLCFFIMLPIGAKSLYEADETAEPGIERGAPKVPHLFKKALWALGLALPLWAFVLWGVSQDLFGVYPS